MKRKVKILSIDGGGIRGIIPAVILNHIEKGLQTKADDPNVTLADYFDLIAGTSTGGILACCYLMPPEPGQKSHSRYFASQAIDMYVNHGQEIFNRKFLHRGVVRGKYSAAGLEKVMKDCMDEVTLADTRKGCIITAYDVIERRAVLFTSPEARKYEHRNYRLRDVARATSAAPTYFEPAAIKSMNGMPSYLIDGAMYAGNPSMCAMVEANKTTYEICANPVIEDVYIVSVGTGKVHKTYGFDKAKDWGAIGWARPLIDILLSASAEVVDYQMRQLFAVAGCSDCYVRLEPELGNAKSEMDDASKDNIRQLIDAGECFVKDHAEELDEIVKKLLV